jgi:protein gp37
MGKNTAIEWTDHSWNPWRGCEQVTLPDGTLHEACRHCYAMRMAPRNPATLGMWGNAAEGGTRVVGVESYWNLPKKWNAAAAKRGVRELVFVNSISDFFEDWRGPITTHKEETLHIDLKSGQYYGDFLRIGRSVASMNDLRRRVFEIIDECQNLIFLLLTKRPQNIGRMISLADADTFTGEGAKTRHARLHRPNVWLGTTICDQKTADQNIPELLKCRDLAPVLFVSAEPLLGPVDLRQWLRTEPVQITAARVGEKYQWHALPNQTPFEVLDGCRIGFQNGDVMSIEPDHPNSVVSQPTRKLDWLICGGESGPGARPMHPEWARSLRDQCTAAGVPFFFKQWGEWGCFDESQRGTKSCFAHNDGTISDRTDWRAAVLKNYGKAKTGRELDGRTWDELPAAAGVTHG